MGYAPADDPQMVIYVVVDRPNVPSQDDAKYATRIVKKILTEVLPYMNIFMTEELSDTEREELEQLQIQIRTPQSTEEEELDEDGNPIPKEGEEGSAEGEEGAEPTAEEGAEGSEEEPAGPNEAWKDFPLDPETGYLVDPATGDFYDPQIGTRIGRGNSSDDEAGEGAGDEWSPAPPPGDGEDTGEP
jgi:stage V sporulation protein D (sporulation-specific penicillin-binding protein)